MESRKPMQYKWYIILLAFFLFSEPASMLYAKTVQNKKFTIVIDPGHGGNDPGAIYHSIKEKNVVLALGLKLGKLINQEMQDVDLVYTRKSDVFIPLHERAQKAIDAKADLFVSLHANSCPNPSIKGPETYVLGMHRTEENLEVAKKENSVILIESDYNTRYEGFDPNSSESYIMFDLVQQQYFDQSVKMAALVQDRFRAEAARNDRGVKQAGFLVLRQTSMPSVLIEIGYLSNIDEAKYLNSDKGQDELAAAICSAVKNYKSNFETRNDISLSQPEVPDEPDGKAGIVEKMPVNPQTEKKDLEIEQVAASEPVVKTGPSDSPVKNTKPETTRTKKEITNTPRSPATTIYFRIQIAVTHKLLELQPYNFRGLNNISYIKIGDVYKYYFGKASSYEEANKLKDEAKIVYPDAFVVAFDGDSTIPVKDALSRIAR